MVVINFPSAPKTTIFLKARFPKLLGKVPTSVYYKWHPFKARVYNPGELASELARFESGTSSKSPPILSVLRPKPRPHKLERASGSGTQQGEGDAGARRSNSAEFSTEQTGSKVLK